MMMTMIRCLLLGFIASLMVACGGGGGSSGANPNQPTLTTTAGDVLTIPAGAFRTYSISGGVPPYQVSSSEPAIAVGNVSDKTLSIGAIAGGKAIIRVFDFQGAKVETEVTVGSSIPLYTTAPATLKIGVGITRTFAIGGGSPPYTVEGGNASVAVVTQTDATHWSITGKALGGADEIKIRDSAGAVVTVAFSTEAPALRISPEKLTMPTGYDAIVTVSGGQPPYSPAGGIPAAVQVLPASSTDGRFTITGNLASQLDVTFVDSAGQSVKVEVTINTATVSFRMSPSPMTISENDTSILNFSMFGFYGDAGTGATSGKVCIYSSDPDYLTLDGANATCGTYSSSMRSFKIVTGARGSRCVAADKTIQLQAVDSKGQTALGTINIVNNGVACEGESGGALSFSPSSVTVQPSLSNSVAILGGIGPFTVSTGNPAVATATVTGSTITVTGGSTRGTTLLTVTDVASGKVGTVSVTNGSAAGSLTVSPSAVTVTPGLSNTVVVSGGSGSYQTTTSNPSIATAVASGSTVTITGGTTQGPATITVTDTSTGNSATVSVTNGNVTGPLTFSPASVNVQTDLTNDVTVSGGSGSYTVASGNPSVATATVVGSKVTVKGGVLTGSTSILVTDAVTGATGSIAVTNSTTSGVLLASPVTLFTTTGTTATAVITGGSGRYGVSNVNTAIAATATISGNTLSVTGGASTGTVNVVVYDVVTPSISVTVTINNVAALIATPADVTVTAAAGATHTGSVSVFNSLGLVSAASGNTSIATVSPTSGVGPFTITGVAVGTTTVTFVDSSSSPPRVVAVGVTVN